ncbi:hypothetical protein M0Q50_09550 [bacterium]|jgi:hypothetical protein|nr:hypothetical protein [bacterium]
MKIGDKLICKFIGVREGITLNKCYTITELHECVVIKDDYSDDLWFTLDNNKYTGVEYHFYKKEEFRLKKLESL